LKVAPARAREARPAGPRIRNVKAPELPRIGGVGPKLGAGPAVDEAPPLSFGAGAVGGLGGSFGDYVGGLRKVGLDVALVVDTTESMQFAIDEVKERLVAFVSALRRMVPAARVGIVIYRDHGDEYVVKWTDLSFRTEKLVEFLKNVAASGGGDWEEAVFEALDAAVHELQWRKKSKKIIVLVGGSPPHPWEVERVYDLVRDFRRQGGYVSTVDVTQRLHEEFDRFMWRSLHGSEPYQPSPMPEHYRETARVFQEIARLGGGELVAVDQEKKLIREVLVLTFGSRWKLEMAEYLRELS
jgi:putative intracellular protease/amidase